MKVAMVIWRQILSPFWRQRLSFKISSQKFAKIAFLFFALAPRSRFGAAIYVAVVRSPIALWNPVSADCSGVAASRFLAAAAARVIPVSFAAEGRKLCCGGCMKVANGALAADFSAFWR